MKTEQLTQILSKFDKNTYIYLDCMDSTELKEVLVEEWNDGNIDIYLTDNAQKHIDYCDTLYGLKKAYAYYVDFNNKICIKNIDIENI